MRRLARVETLLALTLTLAVGCERKEAECKALVSPLRSLGKKLARAQHLTSSAEAGPTQIAKALKDFAQDAKTVGETIADTTFTVTGLKQIADDAAGAAFSLAESSAKMVQAAEEMKTLSHQRYALNMKGTDTAKQLTAATREFDAHVAAVGSAMTAAQEFCRP